MSLFDRLKRELETRPAITFQDERHLVTTLENHARAAVLVPITDRAEPGVILTQRPEWLKRHAGQVAFPGGRMDESDADLNFTALREAEEEIGLRPDLVRLAGQGAAYYSASGFHVTPVLGIIPPDLSFQPDPGEVAEIFEVPLSFLLDPANAALRQAEWNGVMREYFDIEWENRRIWGVTAGILHNLSRQLEGLFS